MAIRSQVRRIYESEEIIDDINASELNITEEHVWEVYKYIFINIFIINL